MLEISKLELAVLHQGVVSVEEQYTFDQIKNIKVVLRKLRKQPTWIMPYWVTRGFALFLISRLVLLTVDKCFNTVERDDGVITSEPLCGFEIHGVIRLILTMFAVYDRLVNAIIAPTTYIPYVNSMPVWYLLLVSTAS